MNFNQHLVRINKDEVMLRDNVRFKSNDFSIETNKVIFDRNKQTAQSNTKHLPEASPEKVEIANKPVAYEVL